MLGLASTASSGSTLEALYSLNFDGANDYVECGLIDFHTDNFSVSCWVKTSDWTIHNCIWSNRNTATTEVGFQLKTNGTSNQLELFFDKGSGGVTSTLTGVPDDTWFHVVCTVDRSGNQVMYLNYDDATDTDDISSHSSVDATNAINFRIGRNQSNNYHEGKITDLAIWNTVLDADAVTAIYNSGKPTNLTFNSGNYDNSSALVAYYKMGNGSFDNKANGVIHDQHNPGFGAELWESPASTNGSVANWNEQGNNGLETVDGAIQITYEDHEAGAYMYLRADKDLSTNLTVGALYKITYNVKVNSGANVIPQVVQVSPLPNVAAPAVTSTTFITQEIYFTAGHETNCYFKVDSMSSDEVVTLDNFSLKQLNGIPGLTSGGPTFISDTP